MSGVESLASRRIASEMVAEEVGAKKMDLQRRRFSRKLVIFGALAALSLLAPQLSGADAAQSEVWSETDGLTLKYSTNHDDLLSTKGSELSLSTDQREQRPNSEPAGGGGEESAAGERESPTGESSEGEQEDANGEQGADSSSRQLDKVPTSGRAHAYSSASNQHSFKTSQRTQTSPAANLKFHELDEPSSSSRQSIKPRKSGAESPSAQAHSSFSSVEEASDESDESAAGPAAAADAEDMTGANFAPDDRASKGSYGAGKIRQPSRKFKEAVRMNATPEAKSSAKHAESSDDSLSDDNGDESSERSQSSAGEGDSDSNSQQADDSTAANNEKSDFESPASAVPVRGNAAQNSIDFDQYPLKETQSARHLEQPFGGPPMPRFLVDQEDESAANDQSRPGLFYDNSVQLSRSALAASSPQKDRVVQPAHFQSRQQTQQQAGASPLPGRSRNTQAGPQAYRQLSYFKGVAEQRPMGGLAAHGRPASGGARKPSPIDDPKSPDSVRDNFISPGHFPGSMPHLTQAASEIPAPAKSDGAAEVKSEAEQQQSSHSAAATAAATSSTSADKPAESAVQEADASEPRSSVARGGDTSEHVRAAAVTPQPEAQQESQQIMPPILMTTTTMAPMLPVSSGTTAALSASSTTTVAPSSTSQAPSLKRFKFRKYR